MGAVANSCSRFSPSWLEVTANPLSRVGLMTSGERLSVQPTGQRRIAASKPSSTSL